MVEFKLPDLGEGIHEAEIVKWHVRVGDLVKADGPLLDVETDKATVTLPSPWAGQVVELRGEPGDILQVGQVMVVLAKEGEALAEEAPKTSPQGPRLGPVPAAPATRRLARELGVDIDKLSPTGPGGRVTPEDVRRSTEAPRQAPVEEARTMEEERHAVVDMAAKAASLIPLLDLEPLPDFSAWGPVEVQPLRSIRRKVARKMVTSSLLIPHVYHLDEADVTDLEALRRSEKGRIKEERGISLTLLAFVVKAVTSGLRSAPAFNASLDPFREEIILKGFYNIGIAMDTGKGLVVPVLRGTACKNVLELAGEIQDLAKRAREERLDVSELKGGTFSITNVGPLGGTAMLPLINYPEVAILGLGRVQEKPVVHEGQIAIRLRLPITLAFDHRVADGADAARFVSELVRQLASPTRLLLET